MSTAPQTTFDETVEFFSPSPARNACERVFVDDESLARAKFEEVVGLSEPLLCAPHHAARVAPTDSPYYG
jgi:hypothetical protein